MIVGLKLKIFKMSTLTFVPIIPSIEEILKKRINIYIKLFKFPVKNINVFTLIVYIFIKRISLLYYNIFFSGTYRSKYATH